jgi:hypothetical protein
MPAPTRSHIHVLQVVPPPRPPIAPTRTQLTRSLPRSLPVVPLIGDKRYYGETPVGLRATCLRSLATDIGQGRR